MKNTIIIIIILLSFRSYGQNMNTLNTLLLECINESKNKYENSIAWTQRGSRIYLNPEGLPNQFDSDNKAFYDSLPLSILSWKDCKKYGKKFDMLEVSYSLHNDVIIIKIALVTVTRKGRHFTHAYWFEDIDQYTYIYSCLNQQWERQVTASTSRKQQATSPPTDCSPNSPSPLSHMKPIIL